MGSAIFSWCVKASRSHHLSPGGCPPACPVSASMRACLVGMVTSCGGSLGYGPKIDGNASLVMFQSNPRSPVVNGDRSSWSINTLGRLSTVGDGSSVAYHGIASPPFFQRYSAPVLLEAPICSLCTMPKASLSKTFKTRRKHTGEPIAFPL